MGVSNGGIVATPDWTLIAGDESWADKLVLSYCLCESAAEVARETVTFGVAR
jgi:hypothetical protein